MDDEALAQAVRAARVQPERLAPLVEQMMTERRLNEAPRAYWALYEALTFLPVSDFPFLVQTALNTNDKDPENEASQEVIAQASLQYLPALHPHLETIF